MLQAACAHIDHVAKFHGHDRRKQGTFSLASVQDHWRNPAKRRVRHRRRTRSIFKVESTDFSELTGEVRIVSAYCLAI